MLRAVTDEVDAGKLTGLLYSTPSINNLRAPLASVPLTSHEAFDASV